MFVQAKASFNCNAAIPKVAVLQRLSWQGLAALIMLPDKGWVAAPSSQALPISLEVGPFRALKYHSVELIQICTNKWFNVGLEPALRGP